jgi:transcriptional regulator with XRE-family HTH domain
MNSFLVKTMETNQILALLDSYSSNNADEIAMTLANDFRRRRIEKNLTRKEVSERSGVPVSNLARFEQKGCISLKNLIELAMSLNYTSEVKSIFAAPKYQTMEELTQIRRNAGKKKAYKS